MTQDRLKELWSKKWLKYPILIIGGFVLFVAFVSGAAYCINYWILLPASFDFVGDSKDWLMFWATFLSAMASFAVVLFTWSTLKQNKEQLNELKRQWEESKRARLSFSIIVNQSWYDLKITNIGKEPAYNIMLFFDKDFIAAIPDIYRHHISRINNKSFTMDINQSNYYTICETNDVCYLENNLHKNFSIKGSYCDKHDIAESLSIDIFITNSAKFNDDLTLAVKSMKKGIVTQDDKYMPIQESLHCIAKKIGNINFDNDNEET